MTEFEFLVILIGFGYLCYTEGYHRGVTLIYYPLDNPPLMDRHNNNEIEYVNIDYNGEDRYI